MEQLAATPVRRAEVILGKLAPYLGIGLIDVAVAVRRRVRVFDVPFRGSMLALRPVEPGLPGRRAGARDLHLVHAKSQLLATQAAMFATYMPALLLSGFMYRSATCRWSCSWSRALVPARYFVSLSRGLFLRGVGLDVLWPPLGGLGLYALATIALQHPEVQEGAGINVVAID